MDMDARIGIAPPAFYRRQAPSFPLPASSTAVRQASVRMHTRRKAKMILFSPNLYSVRHPVSHYVLL